MSAIEKIIEQMKTKADEELAVLEADEKQRIDSEYEANAAQMAESFEKQRTKQLSMIQSKYRQLSNRQKIESRQQTLNQKQQLLNRLFEEAKQAMEEWDQAEMQAFARAVLPQIPLKQAGNFLPGEKSQTYYTEDFIKSIELPYSLNYATNTVPKQAGFIVDCDGVQYNFLFSNLVTDVQAELSYELAQDFINY